MKVLGWILTILSFLALPVLFALWGVGVLEDEWWQILIIGAFLFAVLGMGAHVCIKEDYKDEESGTKFVYFSTFPAFILAFVIYIIFKFLIMVLKVIYNAITGNSGSGGSSSGESAEIFVVYDKQGFERRLKMTEYYKTDYTIHGNPFREAIGSDHYNRFIDDLGNYWRSYDDNETFISEKQIKELGYDI